MSVIITNMDMPNNCYECRFCNAISADNQAFVCDAFLAFIKEPRSERLECCPLEKVKVAEWIRGDEKSYFQIICSNCGREPVENEQTAFYWLTPYCPHCGAKIIANKWNESEKMERSEE